jgi:hypothetical protein
LYDVLDEQQIAETCCPWMTGDREERRRIWDDPVFDLQESEEDGEDEDRDDSNSEEVEDADGKLKLIKKDRKSKGSKSSFCDDAMDSNFVNCQPIYSNSSPPTAHINVISSQEAVPTSPTYFTVPSQNNMSPTHPSDTDNLRSPSLSSSNASDNATSASSSLHRHRHHLRHHSRRVITKGRLAEFAALRLRTAADALDTSDNVSVIVVML